MQLLLQQTLSTQNPLPQSLPTVHAVPFTFVQLPALPLTLQALPAPQVATSQQTLFVQNPLWQTDDAEHADEFGSFGRHCPPLQKSVLTQLASTVQAVAQTVWLPSQR